MAIWNIRHTVTLEPGSWERICTNCTAKQPRVANLRMLGFGLGAGRAKSRLGTALNPPYASPDKDLITSLLTDCQNEHLKIIIVNPVDGPEAIVRDKSNFPFCAISERPHGCHHQAYPPSPTRNSLSRLSLISLISRPSCSNPSPLHHAHLSANQPIFRSNSDRLVKISGLTPQPSQGLAAQGC
jgi:hypothetical protein